MNPNDFFADKILRNSMPIDDFMGLSPSEMNTLLYYPFSDGGAVRIRKDIPDEALNSIPIFRLAETLIAIIKREGFVKLTSLGLMNKKTLHELYDHKISPDYMIEKGLMKLHREVYWNIMSNCRETLTMAGLIRKSKGKLFLTVLTKKLLENGNRSELFRLFFLTFTRKFDWSINDGYSEMHMIQQNAAFPIYMLHKCGHEFRSPLFYAHKLLTAYPTIPKIIRVLDGEEDIKSFYRCFQTRFFERFTEWFGLTESIGELYSFQDETRQFKTTTVFDVVFQFD